MSADPLTAGPPPQVCPGCGETEQPYEDAVWGTVIYLCRCQTTEAERRTGRLGS